jgi:transposase
VVVEATGGFETVVAANLATEGLPVIVANLAQVRAFAKALGQRGRFSSKRGLAHAEASI